MQIDAQILMFLFYASACTMHGSIIRLDPIQEKTIIVLMTLLFVCLFDLILYVPSTIFQVNRDGSSWVEPVLS